jgi:GrpB-like predicted nucleotidyltransferase (UPF0157 family)
VAGVSDPLAARLRAVTALENPGFALLPGTGQPADPAEVTPYDPEWPVVFGRWRARIAAAVGPAARHIGHVGSTSVPWLAAKPVVDIDVGVLDLAAEARTSRRSSPPGSSS